MFVERHSFRIVLGESPETIRKRFRKIFTPRKLGEIEVFYAVDLCNTRSYIVQDSFISNISSVVYSEPSQTSKIELFAQILKVEKLLTILVKRSVSDAWHGSEYVCVPELLDG